MKLISTLTAVQYIPLARNISGLHQHNRVYLIKEFTVPLLHRLDHQSDDEDVLSFPGKRQLISFLSWLDYVDQLSKEAHKVCLCV